MTRLHGVAVKAWVSAIVALKPTRGGGLRERAHALVRKDLRWSKLMANRAYTTSAIGHATTPPRPGLAAAGLEESRGEGGLAHV